LKCQGCLLCDPSNGSCLTCPAGQYLSTANVCTFCLNTASHCAVCSASQCFACERNYYLSNNVCQPIVGITMCMVYQMNSTSTCEQCSDGYYANPTGT
jgi:hypothetical protein